MRQAPYGGGRIDPLEIIGAPPSLDSVTCEALVCEQYWHSGELVAPANVIYLRVGRVWHRLCFDFGIIFWRRQSDPPIAYAMPELDAEVRLDDLGARLSLAGSTLESYEMAALQRGSQVVFKFADGRRITFRDIDDLTTCHAEWQAT